MRKKLLKALEKELVSSKASKTFENDDVSESEEEEGEEEEVEESKMEDGFPAFDDMKEKMKRRIKVCWIFLYCCKLERGYWHDQNLIRRVFKPRAAILV